MSTANMFEVAVRNKLRFPYRGMVSVEDLWDLNVKALDSIFKNLNSQVKEAKEESLLNTKSEADTVLDLQIEIVKYIVSVKLEEEKARKEALVKREQKQKIMQIMATKQDEALQNASFDDLQKMLDELGE